MSRRGFIAVLVLAAISVPTAQADIHHHEVPALDLREPVVLELATSQVYGMQAKYWTRLSLDGMWEGSLDFDYVMYGQGFRTSRGRIELRDLDGCDKLNPWWGSDLPTVRTDWCDLFVSADVLERVLEGEKAEFQLDTVQRLDAGVTISLVGTGLMPVEIDGRSVALPVLELESSVGDAIWVYRNRDVGLVVASKIVGMYSWYLTEAYTSDAPPLHEGRSAALGDWPTISD